MGNLDKLLIHDEGPAVIEPTPVDICASQPPTATSVSPLTLDFLAWIASSPRSYTEAMEAWRTSCPRFPIWEDAIDDGLIRVDRGSGVPLSQTMVVLTPRGHALLNDVALSQDQVELIREPADVHLHHASD